MELMALELRLRKQVPGFTLDVAWESSAEITALLGFSGSGKTMTLRLLAGLLRPDEGHASLGGERWIDTTCGLNLPTQRRSLGFVMQEPTLLPHLDVLGNVGFGGPELEEGLCLQRAHALIQDFQLQGLEGLKPAALSGGQGQRVALARALMRQPRLLLLDEPLSAMDRPLRRALREQLRDLPRRYGLQLVLVTHDVEEAEALASRVVVYDAGRVAQTGTWEELRQHPASPVVRALIG